MHSLLTLMPEQWNNTDRPHYSSWPGLGSLHRLIIAFKHGHGPAALAIEVQGRSLEVPKYEGRHRKISTSEAS